MITPLNFLRDEVRNGFYISTNIKQAWASQLKVLFVIDEICKKHDITYFADWGTLLATVRHGGYIPWDDDLDICMKRDDYEKFRRVAEKELPENFAIQDFRSKKEHWLFIAKVVARNGICFEEKHLVEYDNFPYISCVDIFVMDYLHKDKEQEQKRCDEIMKILAIAEGIIDNSFIAEKKNFFLQEIEQKYGLKFGKLDNEKIAIELYGLAEKLMAEVPEKESLEIAQIFPWLLKRPVKTGYPKAYFEETVRLPFEIIDMPVSHRYNAVAKEHYGNYLKVIKGVAGHDYPFYEGQRANLQKVADFKLPEFTFDKKMLEPRVKSNEPTLKNLTNECIEQLYEMQNQIKEAPIEILQDMQQLAIDFGTLVEQNKGTDCPVIAAVEKYCEAVFFAYEAFNNGGDTNEKLNDIAVELDAIKVAADECIVNRKTVLFLPTAPNRWETMKPYYEAALLEQEVDAYVVPLPVFKKNPYGELTDEKVYEINDYPEELPVYLYDEIDLAMMHPDEVYIQDVFDYENPVLSVPKEYYTGVLKTCSDKIIFVPAFILNEFGKDDYCEIYNVSKLVKTPGFINADVVYAQSENMRQRYLDIVVDFAGEDTREYWENKIVNANLTKAVYNKTRRVLYCIGANELAENDSVDTVLSMIRERFETFKASAKDGLSIVVRIFPTNETIWNAINEDMYKQIVDIIREYSNEDWCSIDAASSFEELAKMCDAYYGEASPIVLHFIDNDKPVMIAKAHSQN